MATRPNVSRINSVDVAKGIAIILMVYGHTEQGAMHRHWWDSMPRVVEFVRFADGFIYSFHMPVFFFVSGLFVVHSVERRGRLPFVIEKVKTILYPYILWGLVDGLSRLSGSIANGFRSNGAPHTAYDMFFGLITGRDSWFLITLFVCQLLALLVFRLPHWAQMAVAMAGCTMIPESDVTVLYRPFLFFPFLVAGMWVGRAGVERLERSNRPYAWVGFACLFLAQGALMKALGKTNRWDMIPIGLAGILMVLLFGRAAQGTILARVLVWCGEASLGIFILSPFFQVFGREIVLRILHTTGPFLQILVPVSLAVTVPGLLWHYQDRLHIGILFSWPKARKPQPAAKPEPIAG